jgi:hypothetical protein
MLISAQIVPFMLDSLKGQLNTSILSKYHCVLSSLMQTMN